MKIITARQQGKAMVHLTNLNDALMSNDAIKRMDAMEHVAELAYIIGGLDLMNRVRDTSESRKRKIPHANGKPGTWDYTSYFVLADGKTIIERHSLKDAKESAEMEIMFRQRDEKMEG